MKQSRPGMHRGYPVKKDGRTNGCAQRRTRSVTNTGCTEGARGAHENVSPRESTFARASGRFPRRQADGFVLRVGMGYRSTMNLLDLASDGLRWINVDDPVMGGASTSQTRVVEHSRLGPVLVFAGEVSLANSGGFSFYADRRPHPGSVRRVQLFRDPGARRRQALQVHGSDREGRQRRRIDMTLRRAMANSPPTRSRSRISSCITVANI